MILYHGSNVEIKEIDLERSEVGKDFGVGFYLTASQEQAKQMAKRRARLYGGEPIVSIFEFDDAVASADGLLCKDFQYYSKEWAYFSQIGPMVPARRFTNMTSCTDQLPMTM